MKRIELAGLRFGRWLVLEATQRYSRMGQRYWSCRCDCGVVREVLGPNLRYGTSGSCGCLSREISGARFKALDREGDKNPEAAEARARLGRFYIPTKYKWFRLCAGRYYSAKKRGVDVGFDSAQEFALHCIDIAPEFCPALGLRLEFGGEIESSPSIDRIDNSQGYVRGNIQVISQKANRIKSDATREELEMFAKWVLSRWN